MRRPTPRARRKRQSYQLSDDFIDDDDDEEDSDYDIEADRYGRYKVKEEYSEDESKLKASPVRRKRGRPRKIKDEHDDEEYNQKPRGQVKEDPVFNLGDDIVKVELKEEDAPENGALPEEGLKRKRRKTHQDVQVRGILYPDGKKKPFLQQNRFFLFPPSLPT